MKFKIIIFIILASQISSGFAQTETAIFSSPSSDTRGDSQGEDKWLAKDKLLHFSVSAAISMGSFYLYYDQLNNHWQGSFYFCGGFTLSLGALKEYYDAKHPLRHHASWRDFIADFAGISAGLSLAYLTFK
jgi:uncharacterized protein YfiM (DUF2279 family)